MDKRCNEILTILKQNSEPVSIGFLSAKFGVTSRSIRYDLNKIDDFLAENQFPALTKSRNGVQLFIPAKQFPAFTALLQNFHQEQNTPSPQQRLYQIKLELLEGTMLTIDWLVNLLDVSRSTIVNDLNQLRTQENWPVLSGPKGYFLHCNEWQRRILYVETLSGFFPGQIMAEDSYIPNRKSQKMETCFTSPAQLAAAYQTAQMLEKQLEAMWSDSWFLRVTLALIVGNLRIKYRNELKISDKIQLTRDYNIVRRILKQNPFDQEVFLCDQEIKWVTFYVLCAETHNISFYKKENQAKISLCSIRILKAAQDYFYLKFHSADSLQEKLSEYCSHAYYRIKYNMVFTPAWQDNPTVQKQLQPILGALTEGLDLFEEFVGKPVPLAEQYGIAALLYEALGMQKAANTNRYQTVLVLPEGLVYSSLFLTFLREQFPQIDFQAVLALHQLSTADSLTSLDFIISSDPLPIQTVPVLVLPSLDDEECLAKIRHHLSENPPVNQNTGSISRELIHKVMAAAGRVCSKEVYHKFRKELSHQIGPIECAYYQGEIVMLKELLTAQTILLNAEAASWQEAVKLCGKPMVENGSVEPGFVQAMENMVLENGPYVVIAPGVAMPHARPEDGVNKMCISLVTLKNPVWFGNEENDPVKVVIGLAAIDNSTHLDAMAELFELLADKDKMDKVGIATQPEQIIELLVVPHS